MKPKIFLGTDHAGFELKEKIKTFLEHEEYQVEDCGALTYNPEDDYPDFISKASVAVAASNGAFGVVLGKSGAGECIVANKVPGVRAVLAVNEENVTLSREHNNANVISIGSMLINDEEAKKLLLLFLSTPFSHEERHKRRVDKITLLEKSYGA